MKVVRLDDWRVHVKEGSQYVVAEDCSGVEGREYRSLLERAVAPVQQALDYLSATGAAHLQTVEAADTHIVWWPENAGLVLRVCGTAVLRPRFSGTLTVRDANGQEVPGPPPPLPVWDESMRFYRQAELADEVFDAARSLWLAMENLLDEIAPWRETGHEQENESAWVKRAFQAATQRGIDLSQYVPATSKAAHNAAHDYFYDELRKDPFHAKRSRKPGLPREAAATARVAERYGRLTRLYRALLAEIVGVSVSGRGGGGITEAGFDAMMATFDQGLALRIGNDHVAPTAPMALRPDMSRASRRVYRGEIPGGAEIAPLGDVRQIPVVRESNDVADLDLKGALQPSDLQALQGQFALRYENAGGPRSFLPA